jgi:hypothetical protein
MKLGLMLDYWMQGPEDPDANALRTLAELVL